MTTRPKLGPILAALADEHSLKLFKIASTGFRGGPGVPEKMGLTKKQFYSRLHTLVKLGLVNRTVGLYKHTYLGSIVNNMQIKPLEESLTDYWNLLAVDELRRSKDIPQKEQEKITRSILNETRLKKYFAQDLSQPTKIIYTYEELVDSVLRLIESARTEIFLASRYYEPSVGLRLIGKFGEGVSLNLLDDNPSGTSLVSRLQAALDDPATHSLAKAMLESPKVRVSRRVLEYSFIVVDGEYCEIEIVNPLTPQEFNLALGFKDEELSRRMIGFFEKLLTSEKRIKDTTPKQTSTQLSP